MEIFGCGRWVRTINFAVKERRVTDYSIPQSEFAGLPSRSPPLPKVVMGPPSLCYGAAAAARSGVAGEGWWSRR